MRAGKEISIGDRARAARTRRGLNQSEVAERVKISDEVYGRFERGLVTPRIQTLLKICETLQVTPNELLLGEASSRAARDDRLTAGLRRLVNVLDGADDTTIARVTEVARWLLQPSRQRTKARTAPKSTRRT
jgi:transcriptional regulator with XRE-family HTH domain